MNFNKHYELKGKHAMLAPSKPGWPNYDEDQLRNLYLSEQAKVMGDRLHAFACEAISLGIELPKTNQTLNMYVNDAIGYQMTPEQPLYYSDYCFGTADAISYNKKFLRIHDLKTGLHPAGMTQLILYASLFCLEYDVNPNEIETELRIYQLNDINVYVPDPEEMLFYCDVIVNGDRIMKEMNLNESGR